MFQRLLEEFNGLIVVLLTMSFPQCPRLQVKVVGSQARRSVCAGDSARSSAERLARSAVAICVCQITLDRKDIPMSRSYDAPQSRLFVCASYRIVTILTRFSTRWTVPVQNRTDAKFGTNFIQGFSMREGASLISENRTTRDDSQIRHLGQFVDHLGCQSVAEIFVFLIVAQLSNGSTAIDFAEAKGGWRLRAPKMETYRQRRAKIAAPITIDIHTLPRANGPGRLLARSCEVSGVPRARGHPPSFSRRSIPV